MDQNSNHIPNEYFPALTGIRAVAAFMVFAHHYNPFNPVTQYLLYSFINEFYIGVTFFFVLSGFLITYKYYSAIECSFRSYIAKRIARIYPMYFILTTVTFFLAFFISADNSSLFIYFMNITFLKGLFNDLKFTGIPQGWTLTVEEMFYFSAPILFFIIKCRTRLSLVLIPAGLFLTGMAFIFLFKNIHFYGFFESFHFVAIYTFFGRATEFFVGIGLALLFRKYKNVISFKYSTMTGLLVILFCILTLSWLKGNGPYGIDHPAGILINNLVLPLFGIGLFYWGILNENTIISNVLASKLFIALGRSSYTFYLIHLGVLATLISKVTPNAIVIFFVLNIISLLLFLFVEDPLNDYFRRKLTRV